MPTHFLENAQNIVVKDSYFVDNSHITHNSRTTGTGLRILLKASIPEALHDSSARYPPPRCHPETRNEYIQQIMTWGEYDLPGPTSPSLLWLKGPAGVGKSAIAQTCAERLGKSLGAAFFFSRPNSRNDANRLFTSIAYQLTTKHEQYRETLDTLLHNDPSLVTKAIPQQFQHLIVKAPLQEVAAQDRAFGRKVIIIDGLDECQGSDFQRDIVNIIAVSTQQQTTPFLWAFMSRPEPHLVATFAVPSIQHLCYNMEVTITREDDRDLRKYLRDGLEEIRRLRGLTPCSFSEEDLQRLVELSAGLFIYAATVLRFIGQPSALGPEGQLRSVLALQEQTELGIHRHLASRHPLSELDLFYTLIMQQTYNLADLVTSRRFMISAHSSRQIHPTVDSELYRGAFRCLLRLCISLPVQDDILTLDNLRNFNYSKTYSQGQSYGIDIASLEKNIPKPYRRAIIRPFWTVS